jgi:predicted flap endonuclease-1-like 5' DNA nuclease
MMGAEAAPMRIEQLPGVEPGQATRLRTAGILSSNQLLRASRNQDGFSSLADATRLAPEVLRSLVHRSELCQVRGIGPATLAALYEIGIDSVQLLAEQNPVELRDQLCHRTDRPPNLAVIENWIKQASRWARSPALLC